MVVTSFGTAMGRGRRVGPSMRGWGRAAGGRLLPAGTGAWVYLRGIARGGEREDVPGDAAARQRTGQMALDMRPRSTCRRLTKAIPVPDMTEACHGDLDTVQLYPPCGHPGLDRRDRGVVGHKDRGESCSRRSGRVGPGPGAGCGRLGLLLDLGVEELEATALVVAHRVLAVLGAGVQPDPLGVRQPRPAVREIPGAGGAAGQEGAAHPP